jgi:hypothetical protein
MHCSSGEQPGHLLKWGEFLNLLRDDDSQFGLQEVLTDALATSPFPAFFFECPPITTASMASPFECVLVDAQELTHVKQGDPEPFQQHFQRSCASGRDIAAFTNLGGDSHLVSPCALGDDLRPYGHIASFMRLAPQDQIARLWKSVGKEVARALNDQPIWISTSGLGVYWLHVRIDPRPKYYQHPAYRQT